jgi:UDP-N-acetylmuramate--alanine ligase
MYHFIGIGGVGMSALARIALEKGLKVSGSDAKESAVVASLKKDGAHISFGHDASQVPPESCVVYSTDISENNPERQEAQRLGLPLVHRSRCLRELMEGFKPLLVTGTHGKTTTSSLLAHTLKYLGQDPAYAIGGFVQSLRSNGGWGNGEYFVAEADESDRSFLVYEPFGAIVTNIGLDHLNYWNTEKELVQGFFQFYEKVQDKKLFFWCFEDTRLSSLALKGVSYGFSSQADLQIENVSYCGWNSTFSIRFDGQFYPNIQLPLIGKHNVLNASAVWGLCIRLGLSEVEIRKAFQSFQGVGRRVEKKGEVRSIAVYDDYGHHPTEIAATLEALKVASAGRRLVVAFQPHRFTRTRDSFHEFAPALQKADVVVLTDIYSAGETPIEGIDAKSLYETLVKRSDCHSCYIPKEHLLEGLVRLVCPGDVFISMGAGDITQIGPKLLQTLDQNL